MGQTYPIEIQRQFPSYATRADRRRRQRRLEKEQQAEGTRYGKWLLRCAYESKSENVRRLSDMAFGIYIRLTPERRTICENQLGKYIASCKDSNRTPNIYHILQGLSKFQRMRKK